MAVVITGIGVRSPLGCSPEEAFLNVGKGTRCVADIENLHTMGFTQKAAGEVRRSGKVVKTPEWMDRKTVFLEESIAELEKATKFTEKYLPADIALNIGSGLDYVDIESLYNSGQYKRPPGEELPSHFKSYALIRQTAEKFKIEGGTNVFSAACAASTQAIGTSFRMLKKGFRKAAITGGSDSMINYVTYIGFQHLGAMSYGYEAPYACKPFDKQRNGTVLGEGTLVMLMEHSSNASQNDIMAEIAGYGTTMDAYAVTDPLPDATSLANAIEKALADASITPDMIDCVHLHGTGTPKNAPCEYKALKMIFGERTESLPVYSLKGQIGHLIGSCGAMEMLGAIYSLKHQVVLPTINFRETDPEAPLHVIKDAPLSMKIEYLLKLNSSFGGENTAIILKRYNNYN